MNMKTVTSTRVGFLTIISLGALLFAGCDRLTGSKLSLDNYNKIADGMSKSQVQQILGAPTTSETKDMIIFKKTTYRYEDGKKFAMVTFKNDEVDGKETNLTP
jgi:outer membrane protein assembly factor BamE (lipoprotein component of BamABCDE complex)